MVPVCRSHNSPADSTESELVGADDLAQMILWTKFLMEEQGYDVKENILYQENKSTILLENNGK